jgi:hypothetical protein
MGFNLTTESTEKTLPSHSGGSIEREEKRTQRCSSSMGISLRLRFKGVSTPLNDLGVKKLGH